MWSKGGAGVGNGEPGAELSWSGVIIKCSERGGEIDAPLRSHTLASRGSMILIHAITIQYDM